MKKLLLALLSVYLAVYMGACATQEKKTYSVKNLERHSKRFIGIRYEDSPLGEGEDALYDKDPLSRFDRFDCLTYVETVMAIHFADNNKKKFEKILQKIRYKDGIISFPTRNHFMSADWIPNNIKQGYITDITKNIAPGKYKRAEAFIQKSEWYKKLKPTYFLHKGDQVNDSYVSIPYIPTENIIDDYNLINRIPTGSIISIVRPNWDLRKAAGTALNISHVGLLIHTKKGPVFRHASPLSDRVTEVSFLKYLKGIQGSETIRGIHVLKINNELPLDFLN